MTNDQFPMSNEGIISIIKNALAEDIGLGDITTNAIIAKNQQAKAKITVKGDGVIAGLDIAKEVFKQTDPKINFIPKIKDGAAVKKGKVIAEVSGSAKGILAGERTALNFLQHLSGIATMTSMFVARVQGQGSGVKILDTRKTIPGLRMLEKYAVKMGGGVNHRMGLYDAVLIKDNHIKIAGGIREAVAWVKGQGSRKIEIEAKTIAEAKEAIDAGADWILLDNMEIKTLRQAVKLCKKAGIKTEASGGISLNNISAIAKAGVDFISVGAITHSAPALDINLKVI